MMISFPSIPEKYGSPSLLTPTEALQGRKLPVPPQMVLFCPQAVSLRQALRRGHGRAVPGFFGEMHLLAKTKGRLGAVGGFGVGGPVIGVLVEELVAWGVTQFVLIGLAGGLQSSLTTGTAVGIEGAIRDEGTSHHYLPPEKIVHASLGLQQEVAAALDAGGVSHTSGLTWTTDAPYRETAVEAQQYQAEGVQTVDMEVASLLAVAQFRQVAATAVLVVSDSLADGKWQPATRLKQAEKRLTQVVDALLGGF